MEGVEGMLECEGGWGGDVRRGMGDVGKCVGVGEVRCGERCRGCGKVLGEGL